MPGSPTDRRSFLQASAGLLALGLAPGSSPADEPSKPDRAEPATRARKFLASLFDPSLDLLPEFKGSNVYWLYHDNYLAAKVLRPTEPELARKIEAAIRGFGATGSGKIEILFGEAKRPLPFRHYRLEEVKKVGDKLIKTEIVGDKVHDDWDRYADLLLMATIAEAPADPTTARRHFEAALKAWDGHGFRDLASVKGGLSATYKLALALIAAARLGQDPDQHPAILARLLAMQRPDGGFVTDYDAAGKPIGEANVETTALAILALAGPKPP